MDFLYGFCSRESSKETVVPTLEDLKKALSDIRNQQETLKELAISEEIKSLGFKELEIKAKTIKKEMHKIISEM